MGNPKALTDTEESAVVAAYRDGATMRELAARFNCSTRPIARVLSERNIPSHPARSRDGRRAPRPAAQLFNEAEARALAQRYEAGAFLAELANEAGTSRKAVNNALRRQGVRLRDKREAQAHLNRRRREKGQRHPNFKGGRTRSADGYLLVAVGSDDPLFSMAKHRGRLSNFGYGYVLEHRLVMARQLGRPLESHETVHHKNGVRDDNRIENLQLRSGRHGHGRALVCVDCGSHNIVADTLG